MGAIEVFKNALVPRAKAHLAPPTGADHPVVRALGVELPIEAESQTTLPGGMRAFAKIAIHSLTQLIGEPVVMHAQHEVTDPGIGRGLKASSSGFMRLDVDPQNPRDRHVVMQAGASGYGVTMSGHVKSGKLPDRKPPQPVPNP